MLIVIDKPPEQAMIDWLDSSLVSQQRHVTRQNT